MSIKTNSISNTTSSVGKAPKNRGKRKADNAPVSSAVNTINRTIAKRNTAPSGPLNQKKKVTLKPTSSTESFIDPSTTARYITQDPTRRSINANPSSTLVVEVAESAVDDSRGNIKGSFQQKQSEYTHKHKSYVYWNRRRWEFKLDIPIDKPNSKLTQAERDELNTAIEKARDIFLADLKQRNSKLGSTDFNFVFTENGYQAYVPASPEVDLQNDKLEQALNDGLITDYVQAEEEGSVARELSTIIQSGESNLGKYINDKIDNSERLSKLCKSTQKQKTAESTPGSFHPVGFKNEGQNLCYLNTAVQQWASNPIIRKELLDHPKMLRGGTSNPLYKILYDYQAAQQTKTKPSFDLSPLRDYLGFTAGKQEDEHEAIVKLQGLINFDEVSKDSPLYSLTKSNRTGGDETTESPSMAKRIINPKAGSSISSELKAQQTGPLDIGGTKTETLTAAPGVLTVYVNRTKRASDGTETKDTTEIDASDENGKMKLAGDLYGKPSEETSYNLMSFSLHIGNTPRAGHYVTYVKDGQTYLEIDDDTPKTINSDDFYNKSKTASVLIYNKGEAAASSVTPPLATPAPVSTATPTPPLTLVAGGGSSTPTTTLTPAAPTSTPMATPITNPTPTIETTPLNDKVTLTMKVEPDVKTGKRERVTPTLTKAQLGNLIETSLSKATNVTFDIRPRSLGDATEQLFDDGSRIVHLDIRDYGTTPEQALSEFETQLISFLGKNPDKELKFGLTIPHDDEFKIRVQKLKDNLAAVLVGAQAPETYVKRDNFAFFYQGAINETPFLVETTNEAATQPVAIRGGDYATAIKTHLASIAAGRIPYDKEEFIIDLRPGDVRSGESLTNKMYFRIGDYIDIEPQAALDALLKEMETFTNPKKKKIRLILPASLSLVNRVKIRNTLANIPAAPATTVPVSPPKNSNLLYRVWDSAVSWIPTIATAATMLTR